MRSSQETIKQGVEEILQIRLRGAQFADIVQHAAQNGWNVKERQLWNYVRMSDEMLEQTIEKDRRKILNRHLAQRQLLYAHSFAAADYATAKNILKDEADLLGLYPPQRQEKPPLEVLLDSLGDFGEAVRRHLAGSVSPGPTPEGDEQDDPEASPT